MFARLMGLKTIAPAAVHRLTQDRECVAVIDVNSRQSWMKARVLAASHASPVDFLESAYPPTKATLLVFYCSNLLCRKAPMRRVGPSRWATEMSRSCRRESAAGSLPGWPQSPAANPGRPVTGQMAGIDCLLSSCRCRHYQ